MMRAKHGVSTLSRLRLNRRMLRFNELLMMCDLMDNNKKKEDYTQLTIESIDIQLEKGYAVSANGENAGVGGW